jgi:hypothetical protein
MFTRTESLLLPFDRQQDQQMPRELDAAAELPLRHAIQVFDRVYDKIFVSTRAGRHIHILPTQISINGIVSFDAPVLQYRDVPLTQLPIVAFAPFYARVDLRSQSGGGVYVRQPIGE